MHREEFNQNEVSPTHGGLMDLGEEITGIVGPVSLCMMMTACLVRALNPDGLSNLQAVYLATAYYAEQVSLFCRSSTQTIGRLTISLRGYVESFLMLLCVWGMFLSIIYTAMFAGRRFFREKIWWCTR